MSGLFENIKTVTLPVADPGAGNTLAQYIFVNLDASGEVDEPAQGADAIGVTLESVTKAEYDAGKRVVSVALIAGGGKCPVRVVATTAVAINANVTCSAAGEAETAAIGDAILGRALVAAGVDADQEVITVLLGTAARQA